MLSVDIICVGKLKEAYWRDACQEYVKRLGAYCKIRILEVGEERLPDNPSPSQITATLEAEGQRILSLIPTSGTVMALCIEGKLCSSPDLADYIQKQTVSGVSHLSLVIGGSWGLSPAVKKRADLRLSMSPMTFPHQLARVMVLEQLYRSFQITSGGKYHK
ncbi:MAG: 23S rRNA (pseudouridine(1915)-N(3))-methyltransferase RlmH [Ruminococcaceae bacterium]|nr:23S rRNA (pseudouridine(1915)-N(3))-methyltransferase RlmH [Oscillospiraceae bacterium]